MPCFLRLRFEGAKRFIIWLLRRWCPLSCNCAIEQIDYHIGHKAYRTHSSSLLAGLCWNTIQSPNCTSGLARTRIRAAIENWKKKKRRRRFREKGWWFQVSNGSKAIWSYGKQKQMWIAENSSLPKQQCMLRWSKTIWWNQNRNFSSFFSNHLQQCPNFARVHFNHAISCAWATQIRIGIV